jgi:hypothetical protein
MAKGSYLLKDERLDAKTQRRAQADRDDAAIGFVGTEKPPAAERSASINGPGEKGQPFELYAQTMRSQPDQQGKKHIADGQYLNHRDFILVLRVGFAIMQVI